MTTGRVGGPDVRETGKLCFTDDWVKKFESYGKPVAEADWYDGEHQGQASFKQLIWVSIQGLNTIIA